MSKSEQKRATAQRALERAVDEETAQVRAELKAAQSEIRALHSTLARIASIAFGAGPGPLPAGPQEKRTLPADLAVAAVLPPEAELPVEPPIDLSGEDNLGSGRWL